MTTNDEHAIQKASAENNASRQRSFLPRLGAVLGALVIVSIVLIGWKSLVDGNGDSLVKDPIGAIQQVVKAAQPIVDSDPDHQAVREWLRRNLDDPHWEEVEWSPTIVLEARHIQEVNRLADEAEKETRADTQTQAKRQWDIMWEVADEKERRDLTEWSKKHNKQAIVDYVRRKNLKNADGTPVTPYEIWETDEAFAARKRFETAKAAKPDRACRLTFRTRNLFGALSLYNYTFVVHEGKAQHDEEAEQYFPKSPNH